MSNHKAYRGVLKARISKLYGGDVTIEKARKLKSRKDATARDKQLANWFINMQTNRPMKKRKDPLVGTGKKPKGSDRRLYTDENPKDTVSIKFATVALASSGVANFILTVSLGFSSVYKRLPVPFGFLPVPFTGSLRFTIGDAITFSFYLHQI